MPESMNAGGHGPDRLLTHSSRKHSLQPMNYAKRNKAFYFTGWPPSGAGD